MNDTTPFISAAVKATQRQALLQALKLAPVSTIEAREVLGIAQPAPRVFKVRGGGWNICTERTVALDAQRRPHTVARYRLQWLTLPSEEKGAL